jgi:glycosyltransferase involved in cell wall biosynthesis
VNAPWLSVIVPTCNGAAYLGAALDSILAQPESDIEIIAIDDGSTDSTLQMLADYAKQLPIRILSRPVGNWAANTNLGLELARGEWICFLHQDDLWRTDRLLQLRRMTVRQPALILHAADFIDVRGRHLGCWNCPLPGGLRESPPARTVARLLVQNFVPLPAALFRRVDAIRVGGLNPDLWFTADWDLWLKLASLGSTVYLPQRLAAFRLHRQSQTMARSNRSGRMREQYQAAFDVHWAQWRSRLANPQNVESAARLSREINIALAARHHGEAVEWRRLLLAMTVGLSAWSNCLQNSRIVERVLSRIKAQLTACT